MKRIFVVEDEAVVALEIKDHLRMLGYEVCGHAAHGEAALRQIPEAHPDLVLMDIRLGGGLSGLDVAERLRPAIDVPVIFLTAYSDAELTERAGLSGSFAYIAKPFDARVLGANIELALVRYAATAALRESAAFNVSVLDSLAEHIVVLDEHGVIIAVNRAWRRFAEDNGAPQPDGNSIGVNYFSACTQPDDSPFGEETATALEGIRRVMAGEQAEFHLEYPCHSPDEQRWFLMHVIPLKRSSGGVVISHEDITEQWQHNAAKHVLSKGLVRHSGQEFFEEVAAQLAIIVGAEIGFVGTLLPGAVPRVRTLGLVVDGKVKPPIEYALPGTPTESVLSGRSVVVSRDVQRIFSEDSDLVALGAEGYAATPLLDASGQVIGHVGVMTRRPFVHPERKESIINLFALRTSAELERQRAEARFIGVFEFAPDALLIVNNAGRIVLANRLAEETFGYSRDELLQLTVEDLIPKADRRGHAERRDGFNDQDQPRRMGSDRSRLWALRKDGTTVSVEISLSPFHSEEGRLVVAAVRDVTERRALEQWVKQRERLDAIGTLAGGIAHDLNNALGPIVMAADILRSQYPEHPDLVDTIEQSAARAAQMVRQLITFAKGTEGERVAVRMRHLIGEMEKIIASSFPKNLLVQVRLSRDVPAVHGDATQLHQVLLNLCVNARDAMPNGGQIGLELLVESVGAATASRLRGADTEAGPYVVLRVRDTGIGIPEEVLDRIFDPFFTTKGPDTGTGLGLSTVLGIVKGHGGFVRVESELSRGSVFSVYLPALTGDVVEPAASRKHVAFIGRGEMVLYVDDDAALRYIATKVLTRLNFTPITAVDGTDGLLQVAQRGRELHAIITDLTMPYMGGVAFVRAARRMLPTLPIIVASGRIDDQTKAELQALGVNGVLNKPFTQSELSDALYAVLGEGPSPA